MGKDGGSIGTNTLFDILLALKRTGVINLSLNSALLTKK